MKLMIALAALAATQTADAQMISAKRPQTMVSYLQDKGFRAELKSDGASGTDGPRIVSGTGGTQFTIYLRNCTNGANCTTAAFFLGFNDLDNVPLDLINKWNQTSRFTRAYIDSEADPVLVMDVDLDHDGLPAANFGEYLDIWASLGAKFLPFLREGMGK